MLRAKLSKCFKLVGDYLDVVIGIALGVVFTVLGFLHEAKGDVLAESALGLLAVLAFSLLRERHARDKIDTTLREVRTRMDDLASEIDQMSGAIAAISSDSDYHTHWLKIQYDLGVNGKLATITKTREICFRRDNVISLHEHYKSDGKATSPKIRGGPRGGYQIVFPSVHEYLDDRGRPIQLVSLVKPRKRGEIIEVVSERTLTDSFLGAREYVNLEVVGITDELIFHVTWPKENPPQTLELTRQGGRRAGRRISLTELDSAGGGRQVLVERVTDLQEGELVTLLWEWEVDP